MEPHAAAFEDLTLASSDRLVARLTSPNARVDAYFDESDEVRM